MITTNYEAIEAMSKTNGGRGGIVVNLSSVLGLDYLYCAPAYVASKHGVIGLTRSFGVSFTIPN